MDEHLKIEFLLKKFQISQTLVLEFMETTMERCLEIVVLLKS